MVGRGMGGDESPDTPPLPADLADIAVDEIERGIDDRRGAGVLAADDVRLAPFAVAEEREEHRSAFRLRHDSKIRSYRLPAVGKTLARLVVGYRGHDDDVLAPLPVH